MCYNKVHCLGNISSVTGKLGMLVKTNCVFGTKVERIVIIPQAQNMGISIWNGIIQNRSLVV